MVTQHPWPAVTRDMMNHNVSSSAMHKPTHCVVLIKVAVDLNTLKLNLCHLLRDFDRKGSASVITESVTCMPTLRLLSLVHVGLFNIENKFK